VLSIDIRAHAGTFQLEPSFTAGNEFVVLFGPSGCGKSLTLQAAAGLLTPDAGRIELPGGIVAFDAASGINLPPQARGVGYVVQELALFPHMTAAENIAFGLAGLPKSRQRERVAELLAMLALEELADRRPRQMSGGQQQRVALARALAAEPGLLLLDEPFSALDAPLRAMLRREVATLRRRLDLTAIFVTHDLSEVYALGDQVVVYDEGRVLQHGPRDEVLRRARSRRVAELVEVRNIVPGRVEAYAEGVAVVRTPWFTARVQDPRAPISGDVFVCIRPEHIIVEREGREPRSPSTTIVDTEIVEEVSLGNTHRLFMRAPALVAEIAEPYVFEVDVPAHPYQVLGIAGRRDWRIGLTAEHTWLVPRDTAEGR
jgi:molybdate transport system ATP-binding protein